MNLPVPFSLCEQRPITPSVWSWGYTLIEGLRDERTTPSDGIGEHAVGQMLDRLFAILETGGEGKSHG